MAVISMKQLLRSSIHWVTKRKLEPKNEKISSLREMVFISP